MLRILFIFLVFNTTTDAQVLRNVLIENFTNTRCSICASRMPGFYNNIKSQSQIIQVAYHPSSPYSSCLLSQHNVVENDARTNFYGIYGGTPRVMVNSVNVSSSDLTNPSIYQSQLNKMSSFDIIVSQIVLIDTIVSRFSIKKIAPYSATKFIWYGILVEDTIFYNAPNGEKQHYNVFRKNVINQTIDLININDSVVFEVKTKKHADWQLNRMQTISWVTETMNKEPLQVAKSSVNRSTSIIHLDSVYQNIILGSSSNFKTILKANYDLKSNALYEWQIDTLRLPMGWQIDTVFDDQIHYPFSNVHLGMITGKQPPLSNEIGIHFKHNSLNGYGYVNLKLYEKNNPNNTINRKYSLRVNTPSSIKTNSTNKSWKFIDRKINFEALDYQDIINIYDLYGRKKDFVLDGNMINISHLSVGIYFLQWNDKIFKIKNY